MKLQNKKTGEIGDIAQTSADCIIVYYPIVDGIATNPQKRAIYTSLAQLNEEWEDYEEPHTWWYINDRGYVVLNEGHFTSEGEKAVKSIGNKFEAEDEAEKAVEKLKAWTRLKDKGARFKGWFWDKNYGTCIIIGDSECDCIDDGDEQNKKDLDLLFGGE